MFCDAVTFFFTPSHVSVCLRVCVSVCLCVSVSFHPQPLPHDLIALVALVIVQFPLPEWDLMCNPRNRPIVLPVLGLCPNAIRVLP